MRAPSPPDRVRFAPNAPDGASAGRSPPPGVAAGLLAAPADPCAGRGARVRAGSARSSALHPGALLERPAAAGERRIRSGASPGALGGSGTGGRDPRRVPRRAPLRKPRASLGRWGLPARQVRASGRRPFSSPRERRRCAFCCSTGAISSPEFRSSSRRSGAPPCASSNRCPPTSSASRWSSISSGTVTQAMRVASAGPPALDRHRRCRMGPPVRVAPAPRGRGLLADRLTVEFLSALPAAELFAAARRSGERLHRLHARVLPGRRGAELRPARERRGHGRRLSAPVYGAYATILGTGVVGGFVSSFADAGREAGRATAQLLAGATPPVAAAAGDRPVDPPGRLAAGPAVEDRPSAPSRPTPSSTSANRRSSRPTAFRCSSPRACWRSRRR